VARDGGRTASRPLTPDLREPDRRLSMGPCPLSPRTYQRPRPIARRANTPSTARRGALLATAMGTAPLNLASRSASPSRGASCAAPRDNSSCSFSSLASFSGDAAPPNQRPKSCEAGLIAEPRSRASCSGGGGSSHAQRPPRRKSRSKPRRWPRLRHHSRTRRPVADSCRRRQPGN
jgi:hypothetical protein